MPEDPCPAFAVLNPGGRDPHVDYADGPGAFEPGVHPPVNFHAYAAATSGVFCQSVDQILRESRVAASIVLLRKRVSASADAVRKLKAAGMPVFVAWKECGPQQVSRQLARPGNWSAYRDVLEESDGILSPAAAAPPIPPGCEKPLIELPTPYPVDRPEWTAFAVPPDTREGIFVGTREFFTPSRNHLAAVTMAVRAARRHGTFATVVNTDGRRGRKWLAAIGGGEALRVCDGRLPYDAYLRLLAGHRLVFQLDRGEVPGQVAGDALLCRGLCLGGNSAIERIAFKDLSPSDLDGFLTDDAALDSAIEKSQAIAAEELSFSAARRRLSEMVLAKGK